MYFTQEDYKKIENWLQRNSVKDSEFQEALPLNGKEVVTVVQDGHNRKISIKDLVEQLLNLGVEDFINVTGNYNAPNISLKEAIRLIPDKAKQEGQVITFLNTEGNWEIYQFIGKLNQWNNPTLWNNPFSMEKFTIDSILPDEEDITQTSPNSEGNSFLHFKDREYDPDNHSGLGRIIIRKRLVEVEDPVYGVQEKNILLQSDFVKDNTVYIIRYDFDLNGQDITLPVNSYIEYEGGSISNGNIIDNASIVTIKSLRKNNNSGKNILTKDMVSKPNTIYEIKYNFDLNGESISIPEGCTLYFNGGVLSNGRIIGSNTQIKAEINTIFNNLSVEGTWVVNESYPQWFGADSSGIKDSTLAIYEATKIGNTCIIPNGTYSVDSLTLWARKVIKGEGRGTILDVKNSISIGSTNGMEIRNLSIRYSGTEERESLINIENCFHVFFENVEIYDNSGGLVTNGIKCDSTIKSYYHSFTKCRIVHFDVGILLTHNANACTISENEFYLCGIGVLIDSCNGTRILNNTFQEYKKNAVRLEYNNYGSRTQGNLIMGNYFESDYFGGGDNPTAEADVDFTGNSGCVGNTVAFNNVTYTNKVKCIANNPGKNLILFPTNATRSFSTLQLDGGLTKLAVGEHNSPDLVYPSELYEGCVGIFKTEDGIPELRVCVKNSSGEYYWQKFVHYKEDGSQVQIDVPLLTSAIVQYYGGSIKLGYDASLSDRNITFDSGRKRLKYGYSDKWHYIQAADSYNKGEEPAAPIIGDMIFDLTTRVPKWYDGYGWVNALGHKAASSSGYSSDRPTDCSVGHCFFDRNLGNPIWAKTVTESEVTWVDATGAEI